MLFQGLDFGITYDFPMYHQEWPLSTGGCALALLLKEKKKKTKGNLGL